MGVYTASHGRGLAQKQSWAQWLSPPGLAEEFEHTQGNTQLKAVADREGESVSLTKQSRTRAAPQGLSQFLPAIPHEKKKGERNGQMPGMVNLLPGVLLCILVAAGRPCTAEDVPSAASHHRTIPSATAGPTVPTDLGRTTTWMAGPILALQQLLQGKPVPAPQEKDAMAAAAECIEQSRGERDLRVLREAALDEAPVSSDPTQPVPPPPPLRPFASARAVTVYPPDAAILLQAKRAWGGVRVLPSWSASRACELWKGLTCNATTGGAIQLSLPSRGLHGPLPSVLGNLAELTRLDLSSNQLLGSLPSSFSNLTRLLHLQVSANQLDGSIPSSIWSLSSLTFLDLSVNKLSGSLPSSIGNLRGLQRLYLGSNDLEGSIPEHLGALEGAVVKLDQNRFTGTLPSTLSQLSILTLSRNFITGVLPSLPESTLGLWDFSNNLISGSCPLQPSRTCSVLQNSCLRPLGSMFLGNCFTNCSIDIFLVKQRSQAECSAYACGSDQPSGPCLGEGTCFILGPNKIPTCLCNEGFVRPDDNPAACILAPPLLLSSPSTSAPPPALTIPSPPEAQGKYATGLDFSQGAPIKALNRWSRYLSFNYGLQNGVPRWKFGSVSAWMAPGTMFIGYDRALDKASARVIRWGTTYDQGACAASWAASPLDAVSAAQTIATNVTQQVPVKPLDELLGCDANSPTCNCSTGFPTAALEYAFQSTNASKAVNPCLPFPRVAPYIVMYERVHFRGWFGLLLTLQHQPALVILEASVPFQEVTCVNNLVFQDPSCYSGNLDHTVVVVGYSISPSYWVIRNSWGKSWCAGGYMRLAIQGGSGVCGMNVLPAYYPVPTPAPHDPCYTKSMVPDAESSPALNPCGGGTCAPAPSWGKFGYQCTSCPDGFVAVNNTVRVVVGGKPAKPGITQTCAPVDACSATLTNPCSVGTCVNDGRGGYSCLCPLGYYSQITTLGQSTCILGMQSGGASAQLVLRRGMTCCSISAAYNITRQRILDQNPGLNCSALKPGQPVNISNPSYSCAVTYTVTDEYRTFEEIADIVLKPRNSAPGGVTTAGLKALNPTANCSGKAQLGKGQVICLQRGNWSQPPTCNMVYTMKANETCRTVTDRYFASNPIPFYAMNPGIDCGEISSSTLANGRLGASGVELCVGVGPAGARVCPTLSTLNETLLDTDVYVGKVGETCSSVLSGSCSKFTDRTMFNSGAFRALNQVPDCRNVYGYQFCCPT